jgi:hypothetical protein
MEQYPAVRFMVTHGRWLAIPVGLVLPVLVFAGVAIADWNWLCGILAIAVGTMAGFAFRTFAELTQIIADMLLPQ